MAKILVVDDSKTLRLQLRRVLETAGHEVIEGVDGLEGLQRLRDHKDLQLIICDVNMPNLDGITMCIRARDEKLSDAPIFMLTTEAEPEMKLRAKAAGVKLWMTKAYNPTNLLKAIKETLKI